MANSSYVDYKDTISMLTNVQYGAWIVIDSSSIPVYGDVAKIPDSLLGSVKGPVKVQSTAYKAVDGKHYISVLLPADNVSNNWEGSH